MPFWRRQNSSCGAEQAKQSGSGQLRRAVAIACQLHTLPQETLVLLVVIIRRGGAWVCHRLETMRGLLSCVRGRRDDVVVTRLRICAGLQSLLGSADC